jgi:hypothetical protein
MGEQGWPAPTYPAGRTLFSHGQAAESSRDGAWSSFPLRRRRPGSRRARPCGRRRIGAGWRRRRSRGGRRAPSSAAWRAPPRRAELGARREEPRSSDGPSSGTGQRIQSVGEQKSSLLLFLCPAPASAHLGRATSCESGGSSPPRAAEAPGA